LPFAFEDVVSAMPSDPSDGFSGTGATTSCGRSAGLFSSSGALDHLRDVRHRRREDWLSDCDTVLSTRPRAVLDDLVLTMFLILRPTEERRDDLGVKRVVVGTSSSICTWVARVSSSTTISDWGMTVDDDDRGIDSAF
jgi:hypothetical protein